MANDLYRPLYTRYSHYKDLGYAWDQRYDYRRKGLINKLLPPIIVNTKNKATHAVLRFLDGLFCWLLDYVDQLRNFKNWNYRKY